MKKLVASLSAGALVLSGLSASGAVASPPAQNPAQSPVRHPTAIGFGGAVVSVDPDATNVGLVVLRRGGNAVDAAVATAAALGVTEPYSAGVGGGGYFVYYNAKKHKVFTIDGRETAPATMPSDAFIDPATGKPYNFTPELVTSGVSVGIPGTLATWDSALRPWGSLSLGQGAPPAGELADRGFVVDQTFRIQTLDNKARFAAIVPTAKLFLPGGDAPAGRLGVQEPRTRRHLRMLGKKGPSAFYKGELASEIAAVVKTPPKTATTTLPVMPGYLTTKDLAAYKVIDREPTKVRYDGLDVYGMAPSSSGGTTMGEALNILATDCTCRAVDHRRRCTPTSRRPRWRSPTGRRTSVTRSTSTCRRRNCCRAGFGAERSCLIDPAQAAIEAGAGRIAGWFVLRRVPQGAATTQRPDTEGLSTTHLVAADKWGNVVSYTLTIEQTGGSGITVPGRGFLLNNELTDFSAVYDPADPNRIEPRQAAAVLDVADDRAAARQAVPGARFAGWLDHHHDGAADADEPARPRHDPAGGDRRTARVAAQHHRPSPPNQSFIDAYGAALMPLRSHASRRRVTPGPRPPRSGRSRRSSSCPAARILAAAEPTRRGGGSAGTVRP